MRFLFVCFWLLVPFQHGFASVAYPRQYFDHVHAPFFSYDCNSSFSFCLEATVVCL